MTEERMLRIYGLKIEEFEKEIEAGVKKAEFKTICDSADWYCNITAFKTRTTGGGLVILAKVSGGYDTGNEFTKKVVSANMFEFVDEFGGSLRDSVRKLVLSALRFTECPVS